MIKRFFAILAAALLMPLAASAVPITYIYSGTASGSLGGSGFTDASFVITAQADTSNVGGWCCSNAQNTHASATISLASLGTVSFSLPTHTWIAENCCMGFGADQALNYVTLSGAPALLNVGYGLATDIGPILATAETHGQFVDVATSGGALTISQLGGVSFQAITSAVPEVSASLLMALGLAGVGLAARRRKD
jgi:hypothetical protein